MQKKYTEEQKKAILKSLDSLFKDLGKWNYPKISQKYKNDNKDEAPERTRVRRKKGEAVC